MGALQQLIRTPLGLLPALSVAALVSVTLWQGHLLMQNSARALSFTATSSAPSGSEESGDIQQELLLLGASVAANPAATSTHDSIALVGPMVVAELAGSYAGLQDSSALSDQSISQAADTVAKNVRAAVSYKTYTAADLHVGNDASYQAMLSYRAALRTALQPLMQNQQNELDLYAQYLQSSDTSYLTALAAAAKNYHAAAAAAAAAPVPRDAVGYQLDMLNSLEKFASVLEQMVSHASDSLASAALLRSYNDAEAGVYNTFNALSSYYAQKRP